MSRRDIGRVAARRDLLDFGVETARRTASNYRRMFGVRDRFYRGYMSELPEG